MIKEIVVFANSVKHGNSCVAGKCTRTGEWIRPVSNNEGAEIPVAQTKKINRRDNDSEWGLKVLNKIKVDLSHHAPLNHQTENYVINKTPWTDEFFIKKEEGKKMKLQMNDKSLFPQHTLYLCGSDAKRLWLRAWSGPAWKWCSGSCFCASP